jgi:hypothetical protein
LELHDLVYAILLVTRLTEFELMGRLRIEVRNVNFVNERFSRGWRRW